MTTVKVSRDRAVLLDGEHIGRVYGEPGNWWYALAGGDSDGPWYSKMEAAAMCARAHRKALRRMAADAG